MRTTRNASWFSFTLDFQFLMTFPLFQRQRWQHAVPQLKIIACQFVLCSWGNLCSFSRMALLTFSSQSLKLSKVSNLNEFNKLMISKVYFWSVIWFHQSKVSSLASSASSYRKNYLWNYRNLLTAHGRTDTQCTNVLYYKEIREILGSGWYGTIFCRSIHHYSGELINYFYPYMIILYRILRTRSVFLYYGSPINKSSDET